jgi:hypothetical protein
MNTRQYNQYFIEASDGDGHTKRFFFTENDRVAKQTDAYLYAQSAGGYGYVVLMGRDRLNDHVGAPIWSEPEVIEEL